MTTIMIHECSVMNERTLLLNDVSRITKNALPSCETAFVKLLFDCDDSFDSATNTLILNASLEFILFYQVKDLMVHLYRIFYFYFHYKPTV